MTFAQFSAANRLRQGTSFAPPHSKPALVMCVAEEVGEICAVALGLMGEKKRKAHLTEKDMANEIADTVTYLDLLATAYGFELEAILREKFNLVSERVGSEVRL